MVTTPAAIALPAQLVADLGTVMTFSADGAGTTTTPTMGNPYGAGCEVDIKITAKSGTIALVVTIQGVNPTTGDTTDILASASITATGTTTLRVKPGLTASANAVANDVLPPAWQIKAVSGTGSTPSITGTITARMI